MALKRDPKTMRYVIKSKEDLIEALEMHDEISEAIKDDITDANMLREAATFYMTAKGMQDVAMPSGKVRKIVQRYSRKWIGTRADLKGIEATEDVTPLKDIVAGERIERNGKWIPMWNVITKRIPDPDKIDELIAEGVLKESEVQAAFVEIPQKPYLQM